MNLFVQQVVFINYLWKRVLARSYAFSYFDKPVLSQNDCINNKSERELRK